MDVLVVSGVWLAGLRTQAVRRDATIAARRAMIAAQRYTGFGMSQEGQVAEETSREAIINRAIEVIGAESMALRWLGTPVPALGYATPISLLDTPEGQAAVLATLTRLEHGVL